MTGRGTLLLVDDEQKIRRTLGQALRAEGHDVLEAASVREAQRVMAERSVCEKIVFAMTTAIDVLRFWKKTTLANATGYWAGDTAFCTAMMA